ncbi:ATP-binding protein [Pengzhenrongella phosphoraccumulans]|jgi:serine/threonine-protein kinase RsbW|uniref:ATP-binding protein n=1 Tax=Pengzhenrongella phosphoraccumulans TaxID=3114394 RepID=UPI00388E8212
MELLLVARPSAARAGRHWVVRMLAAQGVPSDASDVIELLTGELLANAVLHGPAAGDITIRTWRSGDLVNVAVTDESAGEPVVRQPAATSPDGRGMMLIDALSSAWGVNDRGPGGKTVWFNVDLGVA